jgi:hypothetical protein
VPNGYVKKVDWLAACAVAIGVASCAGTPLADGLSFVKSIEEDHGTYYRLKVKLAYKGEPQNFDIVVGCNVRVINYKGGGGNTYEAGLIPTVFGRRMSDGKGLVVRPPNACDGETTANGQVQPDLLPVIVVYDNADTLDFGTAYLSEDAYGSPLSVLKFGGATIASASKAEFEEFRRIQSNLVTRASYHSALSPADVLKRMNIERVPKPWANVCEAYQRYRIPENLRSLVRRDWPEGHPKYWQSGTPAGEIELRSAIMSSKRLQSDRKNDALRLPARFRGPSDGAVDLGLATRAGGGFVSSTRNWAFPGAYYPATDDYRIDQWPADRNEWAGYITSRQTFADIDIDYRNGLTRGFAYCYKRVFPKQELRRGLLEKRVVGRIDGQTIVSRRPQSAMLNPPSEVPTWLFERDEYGFVYFEINLESTRGDV